MIHERISYTIESVIRLLEKSGNEFSNSENSWDDRTASQYIESIFLDYPLGLFALYQPRRTGRIIGIVDGIKRLHAIHSFCIGELTLVGCEFNQDLNGKAFADLDSDQLRIFENTTLETHTIKSANETELRACRERMNR